MERDLNFEGPRHANRNVAEPDFNDERTIQTARKVVPLTVFSRAFTRRRLVFAAAFVLAACLGAASALTIIEFRQPAAMTLAEVAEEEEAAETVPEVLPAADPSQEPTEATAAGEATEIAPLPRARRSRRYRSVPRTGSSPKVTILMRTNDSQPQARLVDEWQERRQRRVARPEPQYHHQRDLFRIREIFEGPRRRRP